MKCLIVYYSRTGITKKVAESLAKLLEADLEAVDDGRSRKGTLGYIVSGKEAFSQKLISIKDAKYNPKDYDLVIIGTPVWAGTMASPIRAYLTKYWDKIERIAFFCTLGGAGAKETFKDLRKLSLKHPAAVMDFLTKEVANKFHESKMERFISMIKEQNIKVKPQEYIGTALKSWEETPDVKTISLKLDRHMDFAAGQYGVFSFIDNPEERPLTFSSLPDGNKIEITVKKMHEFTSRVHEMKKGDMIKIRGPLGETLNFDETVLGDIVFLAGGSGITPFISAIRYAVAENLPNKITLFFSNRTEKDIIYAKELKKLSKSKNIKVINTLSDETPGKWKGETGRINKDMVLKYLNEPEKKTWYLCGPPPMIEAMKKMLAELNVPESKIKVESWQLPGKTS